VWRQRFNRVRQLMALGLLVVSAYCAWLSLMLLDPGNFRTEGSPAGAGMFVVWMLFPLISLGTGLAGLFLLLLRPGSPRPVRTRRLPAARRLPAPPSAECIGGADGSALELLCLDDLAVLWLRRADGSGLRSHNAQWQGDPDTVLAFRAGSGESLRLPRQWAVAAGLARAAAGRFRAGHDWSSLLALRETPMLPPAIANGGERARWDWLRQQSIALTAVA